MTRTRQNLAFGALCVSAPGAFTFLALQPLAYRPLWSIVGFSFTLALFGWSLCAARRHPVRARIGVWILQLLHRWLGSAALDLNSELHKIPEQLQTNPLALLRVELGGENVVPPDRGGESFAISRVRRGE